MARPELIFDGFVELFDGSGVKMVEVYKDGEYLNIYVDNDLSDDVESPEDFEENYGVNLYKTLEDFKKDNPVKTNGIQDFWPDEI